MTKKWFTIIFEGPSEKCNLSKATKNCAGQYVAFDGLAIYQDAYVATERLSKECKKVSLFLGKDLGRCVTQFEDSKELGSGLMLNK